MRMHQASDVCEMTGLTADQLREWCGRRKLVTPDVPSSGRGRHALFSWQTMVVLLILKDLREHFGVEASAWAPAMAECQKLLLQRSFISLWGTSVVFEDCRSARWSSEVVMPDVQAIIMPLDPHLKRLQSTDPNEPGMQLPIFKVLGAG